MGQVRAYGVSRIGIVTVQLSQDGFETIVWNAGNRGAFAPPQPIA